MGAAASQNPSVRTDTQSRSKLNENRHTKTDITDSNTNVTKETKMDDRHVVKTHVDSQQDMTSSSANSATNNTSVSTTEKTKTADNSASGIDSTINSVVSGGTTAPTAEIPIVTEKPKVKTIEEYKEIEKELIARMKLSLNVLDEHHSDDEQHKVDAAIYKIRLTYSGLVRSPPEFNMEYKKTISKIIVDHGKFPSLICDRIIKLLAERNYTADDEEMAEQNYKVLDSCFISLLNYSDCSDLMKDVFGKNEALLKLMSKKLVEWFPEHQLNTLPKQEEMFIKRFLGAAHNMATLQSNVASMRNHGFVQAVVPYLESRIDMHVLSAVATLADIVNEDECHLLNSKEDSIKFLLTKLHNASNNKTRRDAGWSAAELCRTVRMLARNDGNKKLLVVLGCLPYLLALTTSEIQIEQEESIESLWVLAFDEDNKIKMVDEANLIETIERLLLTTKGKVKKLCNGIIWTLQKTLRNTQKYSHIVENYEKPAETVELKKEKTKVEEDMKGHVMISYQWEHQAVLKQICSDLRGEKRNVWMDIDNMEGSTLQAMASAIESAKVVVICMSQKYKDSPNCRAEAEYAFQLRRPIIPLIMERGYRPDGWLGFILGAKLFYDFSGKYSFVSRIDGLLKGVKQIFEPAETQDAGMTDFHPKETIARDEVDSPPIVKQKAVVVRSSNPPSEDDQKIKEWTTQDVSSWLKKHDLQSNQRLNKLTGKEIIFLRDLREEAPEFFYHTLESQLELKELGTIIDFTSAIQNISKGAAVAQ